MYEQPDGWVKPESRTLILDAAQKLFAESGYSATSTASIAESAGVTRTLIFHYFPTKQAILATLLHERGLEAVLDGVEVPQMQCDLESALLELAAQIHDRSQASGQLLQIVLHERSFQDLTKRHCTDFMDQLEDLVHATVTKAVGIRKATPTTRAVANTFAATLLRDILVEPLTGVTSPREAAAHICALALAKRHAPA